MGVLSETLTNSEAIAVVEQYLPPSELLSEYPTPLSLDLESRHKWPGADFAITSYQGKLVMAPPWHPLFHNRQEVDHASDYGTGMFEGLSALPIIEDGQLVGANVTLLDPRMERLQRSLITRGYQNAVNIPQLRQAIIDLVSVNPRMLLDEKGEPSRAYIRPSIGPSGKMGLSASPKTHEIKQSIVTWNWPDYYSPEKVLAGKIVVAASPHCQRLAPILGKHASNYGEASFISTLVKQLGADDALFLAPYIIDGDGDMELLSPQMGGEAIRLLSHYGVVSDFAVAGAIAFDQQGKLLFPPEDGELDVHQLRSTTLHYVTEHLAPALGIEVVQQPYTLHDLETGRLAGLSMVGNAVKITPVGAVRVYDQDLRLGHVDYREIQVTIVEPQRLLRQRLEAELNGEIPPTHSSLLTRVDLNKGRAVADILKKAYQGWF